MPSKGRADAVMTCGLIVGMFLVGAVLLFVRKRCVVDPASRRVENRWIFAGVRVSRMSRSFAEFASVRFDVVSGGRSAPTLRLLLVPRDKSEPFLVAVYVALDAVPPEAAADASELAALMGLPLEPGIERAA